MNINELKKLIDQEVKRVRVLEATNPGTPKAKLKAKDKPEVSPTATTLLKDPSAKPPESKQPKPSKEIQNPEDFYKGILRLHNALRDRFDLEFKDEEVYSMIRDITSEEIEKLRSKYPELDLGGKLA